VIGSKAMRRAEQVQQRYCQSASTSRQKMHQAKADRTPRFRECLIIAPPSSTCRVELHWRLGPGADHGRMARIAEAWDRSTAPGATSEYNPERKRTSSTSSAGLPKRHVVDTYPCDALWLEPVLAIFGQIYSIHFERGPPCQKKRSRRRNRKPN